MCVCEYIYIYIYTVYIYIYICFFVSNMAIWVSILNFRGVVSFLKMVRDAKKFFGGGGQTCERILLSFREMDINVLLIVIHTNLSLGKQNSTLPKTNMTIENHNS